MREFDIESVPSSELDRAAVAALTFKGTACDNFLRNNPRFINHRMIPTRKCGCIDKACRYRPHTELCPNLGNPAAVWLTMTNPYRSGSATGVSGYDEEGDALTALLNNALESVDVKYEDGVDSGIEFPKETEEEVQELEDMPQHIVADINDIGEDIEQEGFHEVEEEQ